MQIGIRTTTKATTRRTSLAHQHQLYHETHPSLIMRRLPLLLLLIIIFVPLGVLGKMSPRTVVTSTHAIAIPSKASEVSFFYTRLLAVFAFIYAIVICTRHGETTKKSQEETMPQITKFNKIVEKYQKSTARIIKFNEINIEQSILIPPHYYNNLYFMKKIGPYTLLIIDYIVPSS